SKTPSYTKSVSWQHHRQSHRALSEHKTLSISWSHYPRHKEYKNGRGKGKGKEKNLKASRMLTLFVNVQ
ncbi:hypothetical protein, partial [Escherichia coli]